MLNSIDHYPLPTHLNSNHIKLFTTQTQKTFANQQPQKHQEHTTNYNHTHSTSQINNAALYSNLTHHPKLSTPTKKPHSLSNPNSINCRTLSNTLSPSYHITKIFYQQPTKLVDTQLYQKQQDTHHTNKLTPPPKPIISQYTITSHTSHLPNQTHNTAHPLSNLQRNQPTRSYQYIITPQLTSQKTLTTQPAKLIDTQLYQKQRHTPHKQTATTPTNQSSPNTS